VRRPLSLVAGLLVAAVTAIAVAPAATAAGTGGIELTPVPVVDGHRHRVTAFHVGPGGRAEFALRNLTDQPVTIRMYAASATRSPSGAWSIGSSGSASWIHLKAESVVVPGHAVLTRTFTVARQGLAKGVTFGAVVLEQSHGTVVERAATLVYLTAAKSSLPERALLPVIVAVLLVAAAAVAHRKLAR
jgi:hypothetical protein